MARRSYPLPAAIDPGEWTIREDLQARVQLNTRQMYVPLAQHAQAAAIRAHELAHVAFTPKRISAKKTRGIEESSIQAVEDYRVNSLARTKGVSFDAGCPEAILLGALERAKLYGRDKINVGLALASFRADEAVRFLDSAIDPEKARRIYNDVSSIMRRGKKKWSFDATCRAARYLDSAYPDSGPGSETDRGKPGKAQYGQAFDGKGLSSGWGKMSVERPELRQPKRTRAVRVSDSGSVLRAPHRLTSDQRIFRACLRAPMRGTVLIDASGSMHLSTNDVARIAREIPAGTVAAYSGTGDRGIVRILAHRGKLAADVQCDFSDYGGNIVDGPALQWLGQQPMPRLWVCDGLVTGKGDTQYAHLTAEAEVLKRRYQIKRIHSIDLLTRDSLKGAR
jgi:hypothetical protein